jgi:hypothetical protein
MANREALAALPDLEGMGMTTAGIVSHTGRSKLIDEDPITLDVLNARREIERQDRAFVAQLRAAILAGTETAHGVLGHFRRPKD